MLGTATNASRAGHSSVRSGSSHRILPLRKQAPSGGTSGPGPGRVQSWDCDQTRPHHSAPEVHALKDSFFCLLLSFSFGW